jgi:hypothetical protein
MKVFEYSAFFDHFRKKIASLCLLPNLIRFLGVSRMRYCIELGNQFLSSRCRLRNENRVELIFMNGCDFNFEPQRRRINEI